MNKQFSTEAKSSSQPFFDKPNDLWQRRTEKDWWKNRNKALADRKEAKEFKAVMEEWASSKGKISQEISRKIESRQSSSLTSLRADPLAARRMIQFTTSPSSVKPKISENTSSSQKTRWSAFNIRGKSSQSSVRPSYQNHRYVEVSINDENKNEAALPRKENPLRNFPKETVRPKTGGVFSNISSTDNQTPSGITQNNFYHSETGYNSTGNNWRTGTQRWKKPLTGQREALRKIEPSFGNFKNEEEFEKEMSIIKMKNVRAMYGNILGIKQEGEDKEKQIFSNHQILSAYNQKNHIDKRRPFSGIFNHPLMADPQGEEDIEVAAVQNCFSNMNKEVPVGLERGLRHPVIARCSTAGGYLPSPGSRLISNPMFITKGKRK